jgi:hypothetical protein
VDVFASGGIQSTPGALVRWADNYRSGRLGGSQLLQTQLRGAEPRSEDAIGHEGSRYGAGIIFRLRRHLVAQRWVRRHPHGVSVLPGLQRAIAVSCNLFDTDAASLSESLTEIWRTLSTGCPLTWTQPKNASCPQQGAPWDSRRTKAPSVHQIAHMSTAPATPVANLVMDDA